MGGIERLVPNGSQNGLRESQRSNRTRVPFSGLVIQRLDEAGIGGIYCNGMEPTHGIPETAEEQQAAVRRTVTAINILIDTDLGPHTAKGVHQDAASLLAEGKITEGQFLTIDTVYNKIVHGPEWHPGELQPVYQRFGNGYKERQK